MRLLLAQLDPPTHLDPSSYQAVGWILFALFSLVGGANQLLTLFRTLFPKESPPASQIYASKIELETLRSAQAQELERIEDELEGDMTRMEHRFESWLSSMEKMTDSRTKSQDDWRNSLSEWQMSIERALGRIESLAKSK